MHKYVGSSDEELLAAIRDIWRLILTNISYYHQKEMQMAKKQHQDAQENQPQLSLELMNYQNPQEIQMPEQQSSHGEKEQEIQIEGLRLE